MSRSARKRTGGVGFLALLTMSGVLMLWLFWRFPLTTGLMAIAIIAALGISARLARWIETDAMPDLKQRKQRA